MPPSPATGVAARPPRAASAATSRCPCWPDSRSPAPRTWSQGPGPRWPHLLGNRRAEIRKPADVRTALRLLRRGIPAGIDAMGGVVALSNYAGPVAHHRTEGQPAELPSLIAI